VNNNKKPIELSEKISNQEQFEEYVMLGLRTKYGIDADEILERYGINLLKNKKETINSLLTRGLINLVYNRIIATDEGMQVLNQIILDIVS
jgi:oxygen-independent coproporphyrinogen-3 oxidase